nr:MAG TPA: hypothetical protein [Caudoviricetes sp.]
MIYVLFYIIYYNIKSLPRGGLEGYAPPPLHDFQRRFRSFPRFLLFFFCVCMVCFFCYV